MGWVVAPATQAALDAVEASIPVARKLFQVEQRQSAGTNAKRTTGSEVSTGAWDQVQVTTVVVNEVAGASLASNAVTLPAGEYEVRGYASASAGRGHRARLYNQTGSAALVHSGSGYAGDQAATAIQDTHLRFDDKFSLAVESTVVVEQRTTTAGSPAYGKAANVDGLVEVYVKLSFYKLD